MSDQSEDMLRRLYRGELAEVRVTVSTMHTEAWGAPSGVYLLTHADFVAICDKLAVVRNMRDGAECAEALDFHGFGNRWFRLSEPVADWIKSRPPVIQTVAHIG